MSALLLGWMAAFVFFIGGALGISMLSCALWLSGSALHRQWQPAFVASARAMILAVVIYLPVLFGMHEVFAWDTDPAFTTQRWFLNTPFAVVRVILYFIVWVIACRYAAAPTSPFRAAIALVAIFIAANLASVDWIMALAPTWHSSDIGLRWCVSAIVSGVAAITIWQASFGAPNMRARLDTAHLVFAANLGWIYLVFVDAITAWSGNLPDEAAWYVPRSSGAWSIVAMVMVGIHLAVGAALLFRATKRSNRALLALAIALLVAIFIETLWLIAPGANVSERNAVISAVVSAVIIVALGYVWLAWLPRRMQLALTRG